MVIWAALIIGVWVGWGQLRGEVAERASAEADRTVSSAAAQLDAADREFASLAQTEAHALRLGALAEGRPNLRTDDTGKPPILRFGRRLASDETSLVDRIAWRNGGDAIFYVAQEGGFAPIATSMKATDGAGGLNAPIAPNSPVAAALAAGRRFTGPMESGGRFAFAQFEPLNDIKGRVIGAYGALFPMSDLDDTAQALAKSPLFTHGYLAVANSDGRDLFRFSRTDSSWLGRIVDGLYQRAAGKIEAGAAPRLIRSAKSKLGFTIGVGLYEPDLTVQAIRLVGASLGVLGLVIVLALCLAWLQARRLTAALDETERSRAKADAANAALTTELEQAARYVESLLPPRLQNGPVSANWFYRPSEKVGGDAFGYHWIDQRHFSFYLLDVCGHGVGAALLATTVMNVLRSRTVSGADFSAPASVLGVLNKAFPMQAKDGMYFTIWYGVYDTVTHELTFASGGHHPAVLVSTNGLPQLLQGKGLPIGCFENVEYPAFSVSVPQGARLYVFSDGIFEVEHKKRHEMFTFDEFVRVILDWRQEHSEEDLEFVVQVVQDLQGKTAFDDDCALMELSFAVEQQIEIAA